MFGDGLQRDRVVFPVFSLLFTRFHPEALSIPCEMAISESF
jgi:hypothetical protein